jgi:uncharacterized protein (UPF0332 family)
MTGLRAKSQAAARAASILLAAGDADGATNRAHYAMFDMARLALHAIDPKFARTKKHRTVIANFALQYVKERNFPVEMGRALSVAFQARMIGDYAGTSIGMTDASEIVANMQLFVTAVEAALPSLKS